MTCPPRAHSFPPNIEASKRWAAEQLAKHRKSPHPAPAVPCREAEPHEVPRSPGTVRKVGTAAGWVVLVTYAKGTRLGADGDPLGGLTESIAVRCRRGDEWAVGVWLCVEGRKWGYESGYAWRTGDRATPPERLDFESLKARLRVAACGS